MCHPTQGQPPLKALAMLRHLALPRYIVSADLQQRPGSRKSQQIYTTHGDSSYGKLGGISRAPRGPKRGNLPHPRRKAKVFDHIQIPK